MEYEYKESDFCTKDEGIQYVFRMFSIIYGARFASHWGDMSMGAVMATWKEMIGNYLTYRPILDFAIKHLDPKSFVPTPMSFIELCMGAGRIPVKPESTLTHQKTKEEIEKAAKDKEIAMEQLAKFLGKVKA